MEPRGPEEEKNEDIILLKTEEGETVYSSSKTWDSLNLVPEVQRAIELKNWITPTLIQGITISLIMNGNNVVAQSKNGSGKTGSFVIATLCLIDKNNPSTQAICVSHTRELKQQNFQVFEQFARDTGIVIGHAEKGTVTPPCQVLCLTFGSLRNYCRNPNNLQSVKILIYDECDFLFTNDESRNIILATQRLVPNSQKILFSATFTDKVWGFVDEHIPDPKIIKIEKKEDLNLDNIDQFVLQCEHSKKFDTVLEILRSIDLRCCIIFINTKKYLEQCETFLSSTGYKLSVISGAMEDNLRDEVIKKVREGQVKVLLTTDVLSRGVDFRFVNVVINLDPPLTIGTREPDPHTYLHRVGRTGRYGRRGIAINIVSDSNSQKAYLGIQKYFNKKITSIDLASIAGAVVKVNTDYEL
jgi:ATP-dependent RNA helicase DDX19/DBP5